MQIHNYYQYPGGEDVVVANENQLLQSKGNEVYQYLRDNKEINNFNLLQKVNLLQKTYWAKDSYNEVINVIKKVKPDICHVHNVMPLISPSVFYACKKMAVPVVHTLHNYRLLCPNAYLFRDGAICNECLRHSAYHTLKYGCYRGSRLQTFALSRMIEEHKKKNTWHQYIDAYICLTDSARNKFIEGGLPEEKLYVKPNFLANDPGVSEQVGRGFIFAGRLDETKGIKILIEAIRRNEIIETIRIAGDGKYSKKIRSLIGKRYLGQLKNTELLREIKKSMALIFPSIWYETFGLLIIESFACGKPVIASRLGAMAEIIRHGETGLLFNPGDAQDLAQKLKWAVEHKKEMKRMGINARKEFEEKYTAEKNYAMLMNIYQKAIENNHA